MKKKPIPKFKDEDAERQFWATADSTEYADWRQAKRVKFVNLKPSLKALTPADFRRLALSLEGAEEGSHMGAADFRVGGRIFATLASQAQGYGNLMLTPELQADFVGEQPDVFVPIAGGWGRMGMTHIRLGVTDEDMLAGALRAAWKLRKEKNAKPARKNARSR